MFVCPHCKRPMVYVEGEFHVYIYKHHHSDIIGCTLTMCYSENCEISWYGLTEAKAMELLTTFEGCKTSQEAVDNWHKVSKNLRG